LVTGPLESAQKALQEGLRLARETGHAELTAAILNDLGNLFASQNKYEEALDAYGESVQVAEPNHDRSLAVRTLSNAALASIRQGQYQAARTRLDMALEQMQGVQTSHDKAYSFINIGLAYVSLSASLSTDEASLTLRAAEAFNAAANIARTINDQRALSYALGHLGELYEEERRYNEALQLTRQALFAAQQVQAPESLYRWQWQTGRLLKALGDLDAAIVSYRHAVDTLQSFRQEMMLGYGSSRNSFRERVGPVYFSLVDLLLQRAAALQDRAQYE